jgi:hypothetical protein
MEQSRRRSRRGGPASIGHSVRAMISFMISFDPA